MEEEWAKEEANTQKIIHVHHHYHHFDADQNVKIEIGRKPPTRNKANEEDNNISSEDLVRKMEETFDKYNGDFEALDGLKRSPVLKDLLIKYAIAKKYIESADHYQKNASKKFVLVDILSHRNEILEVQNYDRSGGVCKCIVAGFKADDPITIPRDRVPKEKFDMYIKSIAEDVDSPAKKKQKKTQDKDSDE
jgi:hypothetical protein